MRLTRRNLILLSAAGAAGLAAASGAAAVALGTGPENVVVQVVRHRLPDLSIPAADLEAFARDFLVYDRTSRDKLAALRLMLPVLQSDTLAQRMPASAQRLFARFERRAMTKFLLATGYLERDAGSRQPLSYTGAFPDPYLASCANPLAQFDLDQTS